MSYQKYEDFEQEMHMRLRAELNELHLSTAKKEEIISLWQNRKKPIWQHIREWGEREISLTFSSAVTAVLVIFLFFGGWMLTNRSELFLKVHNNAFYQKPIVYVNVVRNQNGEIPLSEQGEMYLRKEYE